MKKHLISARPGNGKTRYLVHTATELLQAGKKVAILAFELTENELRNHFNVSPQITILDCYQHTPKQVERLLSQYNFDALLVDCVNLCLTHEGDDVLLNRDFQEVSEALEAIAQSHNADLYLTRQLSRSVDERENKQPVLEDLYKYEKDYDSITSLCYDQIQANVINIVDLKTQTHAQLIIK